MKPEIFSRDMGNDPQALFQKWQADHPSGFYVNRTSTSEGMVHKVGCGHVGGPSDWEPRFGDLVKNAKICHLEPAKLLVWAKDEKVFVTLCEDCKPWPPA